MEVGTCTKKRKRELAVDLTIIMTVSFLALGFLVSDYGKPMMEQVKDSSVSLLARVAMIGFGGQFAVAGLGLCIVCLIRRESFTRFGLTTKNLIPSCVFSLLFCIPELLFYVIRGEVHGWCPFWGVNIAREVLAAPIGTRIPGMLIIGLCWGFFEGFNYVVIRDKISEQNPSKYRFWDWGAFVCAIMCILIHGIVGVNPEAIAEMLATMILIYGMLIVRKETGNSWGCILVFFVYWNALKH